MIRLLNEQHEDYGVVQDFFDNVVEPVTCPPEVPSI